MAGGKVVQIPTSPEQNFKISAEQLQAAITPKTKLFMFSSPCNPSGALYTREELESLAVIFEQYPDIYIMSDEIYEHINFTGDHVSIASIPALKERVIVINGLSKGFAMTGWRLGYMAASVEVAKACEKIQGQVTSGANAVTQRAAIAALNGSLKPTEEMVASFKERRDTVMELLSKIPNVICATPPAAFYVFPDVSAYYGKKTAAGEVINNADELCMYFLNEAHVSVVTGKAFGEPKCVRLSFANSVENIKEGLEKITKALAALA